MSRTRIDIEEIEALEARRREINDIALGKIDFYRNGVKIKIPRADIKEFEWYGLSNIHFVELALPDAEVKPVEIDAVG